MNLVVDASVVIKWFVEEPFHVEARRLAAGPDDLHAPELLIPELVNVTWKKQWRGELTAIQGSSIVTDIGRGILQFHAMGQFAVRALDLSVSLNHPAYDCFYIACAEMLDATLITADTRLIRVAHAAGIGRVQPLATMQ